MAAPSIQWSLREWISPVAVMALFWSPPVGGYACLAICCNEFVRCMCICKVTGEGNVCPTFLGNVLKVTLSRKEKQDGDHSTFFLSPNSVVVVAVGLPLFPPLLL